MREVLRERRHARRRAGRRVPRARQRSRSVRRPCAPRQRRASSRASGRRATAFPARAHRAAPCAREALRQRARAPRCAASRAAGCTRPAHRVVEALLARRQRVRVARASRAQQRRDCSANAWRSGTTSAAAAVGVGARTSATKSQIVKSVSWPTPDTTGSTDSNTARATASSLNDHRSSIEPPPRRRSARRLRHAALASADRARDLGRGPSPCTGVGIDDHAQRRPAARAASSARRAAPRRAAR